MFGNLFKTAVNAVNTVVQNIAKKYGGGWFSEGVQKVTDSVNKAIESSNSTGGGGGYSSNANNAPIVQSVNDEDNDSIVKRAKRKKKSNSSPSPAPTQPDPIPEDVGVTTEEPVVIYRSRDQKLTEAEEDQIDYLLAVEDDPLAKDMLLKIKNEGLPQDIEFADYMKQFAQWGWDDLSDEHAKAIMEIIMQDRADDQIESLVVFDEETGFVILDRIGIEGDGKHQYVGLQIEEIEMMRGRDVIFLHNHPGEVDASVQDLQVAWLAEAESVIIVTPEGFEYKYTRGENGMIFDSKRDLPFEVAPATAEEYLELQKLSQQQAVTNYYNRPEYEMYQDGEGVTIVELNESEKVYALELGSSLAGEVTLSESVNVIGKSSKNSDFILIEKGGIRLWVHIDDFVNVSIETDSLQLYDPTGNPVSSTDETPPTVYIFLGGSEGGPDLRTDEAFATAQAPAWTTPTLMQLDDIDAMHVEPYPGTFYAEGNAIPFGKGIPAGKQLQAMNALGWLDTNYPNGNVNVIVVGFSAGSDAALIFADMFQSDAERSGRISGLAMLGGSYYTDTSGYGGSSNERTNIGDNEDNGYPEWVNIVNNAIQNDTRVIILDDNVIGEPDNLATFNLTDPNSAELYRYLNLPERIHNLSEHNHNNPLYGYFRDEYNSQGSRIGQDLQDVRNRGYLNLEGTVDSSNDIRNAILNYLILGTEIPDEFMPEIRSQTIPE